MVRVALEISASRGRGSFRRGGVLVAVLLISAALAVGAALFVRVVGRWRDGTRGLAARPPARLAAEEAELHAARALALTPYPADADGDDGDAAAYPPAWPAGTLAWRRCAPTGETATAREFAWRSRELSGLIYADAGPGQVAWLLREAGEERLAHALENRNAPAIDDEALAEQLAELGADLKAAGLWLTAFGDADAVGRPVVNVNAASGEMLVVVHLATQREAGFPEDETDADRRERAGAWARAIRGGRPWEDKTALPTDHALATARAEGEDDAAARAKAWLARERLFDAGAALAERGDDAWARSAALAVGPGRWVRSWAAGRAETADGWVLARLESVGRRPRGDATVDPAARVAWVYRRWRTE